MRTMINSLTEDILHSFNISIPIDNIDELVRSLELLKRIQVIPMGPLRKMVMDLLSGYRRFRMNGDGDLRLPMS